jgi:heavy metal efflux system protein
MLNAIIRFSIKNKLIIGLLIIAWICWGVIEMLRLPIDALPDITSNQVQVITTAPTLAAPEVERLITFPVEQVVSNIPNIREIRSISRFGLSVITIVFSDGTDLYRSRQQVAERIALVRDAIPGEAGQPEMAPVTTGLGKSINMWFVPRKDSRVGTPMATCAASRTGSSAASFSARRVWLT